MSGKEKEAAALEEKLQLLRSATKSNAGNKTSILVDASKYIRELKDKVDEAAEAASQEADSSNTSMQVNVSSVDLDSSRRGFRINVSTERSLPGLLVSVLEAFEELGLDVLDADVSCADDSAFRLQALIGSSGQGETVDEQMVRQAVLQAINKCAGVKEGEEEGELLMTELREGDGVAGGGLAPLLVAAGQHVAQHLRPRGLHRKAHSF